MNKAMVRTFVVAGTLAVTANVNASVNPDQIDNNVMRRIASDARHSLIGDQDVVQDWEQSWPQWSQCHNPAGC